MLAYLGLVSVLIFEYIRPNTWIPALGPVGTLLALLTLALSLTTKSANDNIAILRDKNGLYLIWMLGMVTISVLTAPVTEFAFTKFKTVLGYFFLFFVIVKLLDDAKRIRQLYLVMVLIHIALLAINPDVILNPETRNYLTNAGFLGDGNDFAWSVCIVLPMALFLFLEARNFLPRLLFGASFSVLILAIIGSQSRGATLGVGAMLFYQWLRGKNKAAGVIAVFVLVSMVLMFAPPQYFERMDTLRDYEHESSAALRLILWDKAIDMANDHPFLGVGAGHFSVAFGTTYRPVGESTTSMPWQNAHSIYFMILAELGYPGLLMLLLFVITNLVTNNRRIRDCQTLDSANVQTHRRLLISADSCLISFAVTGAFLSGIYYPHFYIVAGVLAANALLFQRKMASMEQATTNQNVKSGQSLS
jgi:probable O-glycosylation ligase (exosortase A-associated)